MFISKYKTEPSRVRFFDKYDAIFWRPILGTPQGDLYLCKHMRCAFGSKVTIDTWIEVANPPAKKDKQDAEST